MAYKVDPPHWWSRQLHPVFHVSMLKLFYEDTADLPRGQIRRQGLKPKAVGKRVAESILNDRVITASRKRHQEYLVKWQGHMDEENTWERAADLSAYADKIEAYHMQKLTRASTALVGENVTGCPLHPPSTAPSRPSSTPPPRPSSSAPLRPFNMRPCALAIYPIKSNRLTRQFTRPARKEEEEEEEVEIDQRRLPADYDPATFDPTEHHSPPTDRVWKLVDEVSGLTLIEVAELTSIMMNKMLMKEMPVIGIVKPGAAFAGMAMKAPTAAKEKKKPEKTV
ncbi:hypothetical protein RJ639_038867 [Escallonia herrerae]|uniref:Chromo domain-containing protein n=1 Tax=Escallonia herrerae TaxID=1293975 RepID=A0AA89B855_9ASTE|nr:hypothetical protein RJ639_038867 [Escallonia herrerae]